MEWTWDRSVTGSPVEVVVTKLDACQKSLSQWSKHSFCHVRREISKKKKVLKVAEREATQGKNVERFLKLKSEIADLLCLEKKCGSSKARSIG